MGRSDSTHGSYDGLVSVRCHRRKLSNVRWYGQLDKSQPRLVLFSTLGKQFCHEHFWILKMIRYTNKGQHIFTCDLREVQAECCASLARDNFFFLRWNVGIKVLLYSSEMILSWNFDQDTVALERKRTHLFSRDKFHSIDWTVDVRHSYLVCFSICMVCISGMMMRPMPDRWTKLIRFEQGIPSTYKIYTDHIQAFLDRK